MKMKGKPRSKQNSKLKFSALSTFNSISYSTWNALLFTFDCICTWRLSHHLWLFSQIITVNKKLRSEKFCCLLDLIILLWNFPFTYMLGEAKWHYNINRELFCGLQKIQYDRELGAKVFTGSGYIQISYEWIMFVNASTYSLVHTGYLVVFNKTPYECEFSLLWSLK